MLTDEQQEKLRAYLELMRSPVDIVASLADTDANSEFHALFDALHAARPELIRIRLDGNARRRPSFAIQRTDKGQRLQFSGLPTGKSFSSLVLALLWSAGHPPKVNTSELAAIRAPQHQRQHIEVYSSKACDACIGVVQGFILMAIENSAFDVDIIEGADFASELAHRDISHIPTAFANGRQLLSGLHDIGAMLARLAEQTHPNSSTTQAP